MDTFLLAFVILSLLFSLATAAAIHLLDRKLDRRDTRISVRRQETALEPQAAPKQGDPLRAGSTSHQPVGVAYPGSTAPQGRAAFQPGQAS